MRKNFYFNKITQHHQLYCIFVSTVLPPKMTTSLSNTHLINSNPFPGLQELRNDMTEFLNSLDDLVRDGKKQLDSNREQFLATLRADKGNHQNLRLSSSSSSSFPPPLLFFVERRVKLQNQKDSFDRKRDEMQKRRFGGKVPTIHSLT